MAWLYGLTSIFWSARTSDNDYCKDRFVHNSREFIQILVGGYIHKEGNNTLLIQQAYHRLFGVGSIFERYSGFSERNPPRGCAQFRCWAGRSFQETELGCWRRILLHFFSNRRNRQRTTEKIFDVHTKNLQPPRYVSLKMAQWVRRSSRTAKLLVRAPKLP